MAEIKPFCGYRYRLQAPEQLGQYVSPPYDMLDSQAVDSLYDRDPHNAVRLIQNKPQPGDSTNKDRHIRAAGLLKSWIAEGHLGRDPEEGLYVYRQHFTIDLGSGPRTYVRTGVTLLVRLVDFSQNIVYPHENTLSGPKMDRYELLEATRCNTGQIFGLVPDDGALYEQIGVLGGGEVAGCFDDADGVRHELVCATNTAQIEQIRQMMRDRTILIADGHHRYETALKYARDTGAPEAAYLMMTLVSMADPGLVIRPFHRLVRTGPLTRRLTSAKDLEEVFDVIDCGEASMTKVQEFMEGKTRFEMLFVDAGTKRCYGLNTSAEGARYLEQNNAGMSAQWNALSVSRINRLVVEKRMGQTLDGNVLHEVFDYVNDAGSAFERAVAGGAHSGCFFIRPLDIESVKNVVAAGERMPQKSTNFYPKLYSGLVFNVLER